MDAAFSSLDFPGLDWGGYSREEVLDLLTEAALDSLDQGGADFAADQPRVPAGSPEGGQFGPGGGGGTKAGRPDPRVAKALRKSDRLMAEAQQLGFEAAESYSRAASSIPAVHGDLHAAVQAARIHSLTEGYVEAQKHASKVVNLAIKAGITTGPTFTLLHGALGAVYKAKVAAQEAHRLRRVAYKVRRKAKAAVPAPKPPAGADFAAQAPVRVTPLPADFTADLPDSPAPPPDPAAFFALAERDGAAAALAAWEEAQFYSPDQPRDDRGRWSAGGGGASATGGGPNADALNGDIPSRFAAGDNPAHTAKAYGLPEDFYDDQRRMHHGASGIPDMTGAVYVNEKYDPEGKVAAALEAKADAYKRGLYEGSRRKGYDERVRAALAEAAQRAAGEAGPRAAPNDFRGGMTHAARSGARAGSAQAVRDFVAKGGPASGEEVAALGNHLARLTVAQLHALRAEHGLPAAGAWRMRRPDLVRVLAERFQAHRAGTPTRAARELAAAVAGNPAFKEAGYKPSDAVHAVQHEGTGFRATAHPDGRFHVFGPGLAHEGVHDTAAAAVAHAANPPAKPSPDYQPRTADVETAARQGAVADAAARRAGESPHRITAAEVDAKPWQYDADQYQAAKGVHAPWVGEISPMQYGNLSKRQQAAYDEKRRGEWQASADVKAEWRQKVIAAHDRGEVGPDAPGIHPDARSAILLEQVRRKEQAGKESFDEALKQNNITDPSQVEIGHRVYDRMSGRYGTVVQKRQGRVVLDLEKPLNSPSGQTRRLSVPARQLQRLEYQDLKAAHEGAARFDAADDTPAERPVRFVPLVQPAEAARA